MLEGVGEGPAGGRQIPIGGDHHVDDLPKLVDRPVQINPLAGDFDVGLVGEPAISRDVPAGPRRVDEQRREPLHPAVDRYVIDRDATLGQQFFHVPVGQ